MSPKEPSSQKKYLGVISLILFDTYFGIDFGCVWASILSPCWHPFGINVRVLGRSFLR